MRKILLLLILVIPFFATNLLAQRTKRFMPPVEMPSISFVIKYGIDRSKGEENKEYTNKVRYVFVYKKYVAFRDKEKDDWKVVHFDPDMTEVTDDDITFYNIDNKQAVSLCPKNKVPSIMFFDEKENANISFIIDIEETNKFLEYLKDDD